MGIKSVKSYTNPGDAIAALCGIKHYCKENDCKVIFYQQLYVKNDYYVGANHPTKDEMGNMVCCNEEMFYMMKPLFEYQDYIESFDIWKGQEVTFDLGLPRTDAFINIPHGAIQNWDGLLYSEFQGADISQEWIKCPKWETANSGKIAINFTERYRNQYTHFYFLKPYEKELIFFGTEKEHEHFTKKWGLNIKHVMVADFLDLASLLKSCKFFLGNQSMMWNLCQSMQVPRILEICHQFPNCIHGIGKNSYGYLTQDKLEKNFKKLFER